MRIINFIVCQPLCLYLLQALELLTEKKINSVCWCRHCQQRRVSSKHKTAPASANLSAAAIKGSPYLQIYKLNTNKSLLMTFRSHRQQGLEEQTVTCVSSECKDLYTSTALHLNQGEPAFITMCCDHKCLFLTHVNINILLLNVYSHTMRPYQCHIIIIKCFIMVNTSLCLSVVPLPCKRADVMIAFVFQ